MKNSSVVTVAGALAVLVLIAGIWYLATHERMTGSVSSGTPTGASTTTSDATYQSGSSYFADMSQWVTVRDTAAGFYFQYPRGLTIEKTNSSAWTSGWRQGAGADLGILVLTLTVPGTFEPKTNFSDAKLTIGRSANNMAMADCFTNAQGGATASSTTTMNGIHFTVLTSADAGAGNFYQTRSYRTIHNGQCYAIEYTVHSTQLANYPSSAGISAFDKGRVDDLMTRIITTFRFL